MPFLAGNTVEQVLLLISGSVKIGQLGCKGLALILRLGAPGDVFDVVSSRTGDGGVARQLIRLQEQVGSPRKAEMEVGLSREGLAQMTGTTLYTVSRLLSTREEDGLVNPRRESMIITDVPALRKVIEEN
jgi:CRP-like cAMP-binding protein